MGIKKSVVKVVINRLFIMVLFNGVFCFLFFFKFIVIGNMFIIIVEVVIKMGCNWVKLVVMVVLWV